MQIMYIRYVHVKKYVCTCVCVYVYVYVYEYVSNDACDSAGARVCELDTMNW